MKVRERLYDIAIPAPLLKQIEERRKSPTGLQKKAKQVFRGGGFVWQFPWKRMELGDFFIVPITADNKKSMRVSFFQYAARHDIEIAVLPWPKDGVDHWRVTITIIGVGQWKNLAEERHDVKGIRYSDGKWAARKKVWRRAYDAKLKFEGQWVKQKTSDPLPTAESFPRTVKPSAPLPTPTPSKPMVPVAMMTTEEIIALSLEMSRAEQEQTTL